MKIWHHEILGAGSYPLEVRLKGDGILVPQCLTIYLVTEIFVTPMDGSLVIMDGSLLSRFLLFQWMVALSLWKVVCCSYFCYSNGW